MSNNRRHWICRATTVQWVKSFDSTWSDPEPSLWLGDLTKFLGVLPWSFCRHHIDPSVIFDPTRTSKNHWSGIRTPQAWRKGLRRIMGLPYAAHFHLLPLLSNTLPIFNEICRRSAKFILSCLCSGLALFRTVANYGILARSHSFIGSNVMFLCNRFHFSAADFKFGQASHLSNIISRHHLDTVWWGFICC